MRLKLTVAYDGTAFCGWQSQRDGGSVQDRLQNSVSAISGLRVVVHGAGRTDAGVHALGQCCHMDVPDGRLDPDGWVRALNGNLPPSIRVLAATPKGANFHARFSSRGKVYRYRIAAGPVLMPLEVGRAWHVPHTPDLASMREIAALFEGCHNFEAFSANRGTPPHSTERNLQKIRVFRSGTTLTIEFHGEGFLYKMARMLTAAILRGALGREKVEGLVERLHTGGPRWTHVAPAHGLCLVRVHYS